MPRNEPWYWGAKYRNYWRYTPPGAGANGQVPIVDENGNKIRGNDAKAKKLAYFHWARMENLRQGSALIVQPPVNPPVSYVLAEYLTESKGRFSEKTFEQYQRVFRQWHEEMGELPLSRLSPGTIYEWFAKHPAWSLSTQATHLLKVRAALRWAREKGLISSNPLARMAAPALGARGMEAVCTPENYRAMVAAITDPDLRDPYVVIAETGARPGSILMTRVKDLLVDRSSIEDWHHKRVRKTGKPIYIALSPAALEICKRRAEGRQPDDLLFPSPAGYRYEPNRLTRRLDHIKKKLGLTGAIFPYSLRHSLATRMLQAGHGLHEVAAQLNNSPDVVHKHYGHATEQHDRKVAIAAEMSLSNGQTPNMVGMDGDGI